MNQTPHRHEVKLHLGPYKPSITYGDTRIRLYQTHPSAQRVTRLTRRVIKRHDEGSLRADVKTRMQQREQKRRDKRREKVNRAYEAAGKVYSEWYMDSPERMDDLHAEALSMDLRRRPYRNPFDQLGGSGDTGHVGITPSQMRHTFGLTDPPEKRQYADS